ncbi:hypothetical protein V8C37DRAFT_395495 [Trichoderma ceciliae]
MSNEACPLETESRDSEAWELSFSLQSALTLAPIHSTMSYHLSLDHLDCIRRRLNPGTKKAFIPELSCKDSCTSEQGTSYRWSSEIYFRKGSFLQKQEITCFLTEGFENPAEDFTGCPHQSLTISTPEFKVNNNMLEVQAWVTNHPPRCASHTRQKWSNCHGPYTQIVICRICHSDAECVLELRNRSFYIRYTCYRNLGLGMDPTHSKWLALLTGEGRPHRQQHNLKLYARVWRTAYSLQREGLHEVTHRTPNALFNVREGYIPY